MRAAVLPGAQTSSCILHLLRSSSYMVTGLQDAWRESSSPLASPFAAAAQRALADRPGSGSRVYRTATSPAASMSSYSSAAPDQHPGDAISPRGGALGSPGHTLSSGSNATTRVASRTAAGSSSGPAESPGAGRDASPGPEQAPQAAAQADGGSFASPFEAEVLRRKTASEPSSPHDSPHTGSPHGSDGARPAPQALPPASPAVRQVLSFECKSVVAASSRCRVLLCQ